MSEPTEFYTPEDDVTETLPDGRTILAAPRGVPIPLHEARKRGFVKDQRNVGPQETKEGQDAPQGDQATQDAPSGPRRGFRGADDDAAGSGPKGAKDK